MAEFPPERAIAFINQIGIPWLLDQIAPLLDEYADIKLSEDRPDWESHPTTEKTQYEVVEKAAKRLKKALLAIGPSRADSLLMRADLYENKGDYEFGEEPGGDEVVACLDGVSRAAQEHHQEVNMRSGGRPKHEAEIRLLSAVAAKIEDHRFGLVESARLAHEILLRCGIPTPSDNPRKIIRTYRKG